MVFKVLTPTEVLAYRQYAREHDPKNMAHWSIYHPVCRDEWEKRGITSDIVCNDEFVFDRIQEGNEI